MPDRDEFAHLSRSLRGMAHAFADVALGGILDCESFAAGLDCLLAGGVASLPAQLENFDRLCHPTDQLSLTTADPAVDELDRIEAIAREHGRDRRDLLLMRVVQRATVSGLRDRAALLRDFVDSLVAHRVVDAKRGVLDSPVSALDLERARNAAAPLVSAAAEELERRPNLKRSQLARNFRSGPIDLHEENLLAHSELH